jgi:AraC family transcriptional activator of pobA
MLLARRRAVAQATAPAGDARGATFVRFRALVEAHYAERWPASRYAQALAITQSRLDRTCRAASGRSAFEIVQDRVLLEARRKLVHVAAPVSALAYELGFEDPAYFCRFFKRRVGSTPTQWRRAQRDRLAGLPDGDPK